MWQMTYGKGVLSLKYHKGVPLFFFLHVKPIDTRHTFSGAYLTQRFKDLEEGSSFFKPNLLLGMICNHGDNLLYEPKKSLWLASLDYI